MAFDFGEKPRTFGDHMARAGATRTEIAVRDGDADALDRIAREGQRSSYTTGVVVGSTIGLLGLAFRRR